MIKNLKLLLNKLYNFNIFQEKQKDIIFSLETAIEILEKIEKGVIK